MIVDKIKRYVWLLDTIYRSGETGITFDEINEKWQRYDLLSEGERYPKRTFEQHKDEIQSIFNVEICCDRKTNRYYIDDRDELRNNNLVLRWLINTFNLNNIIGQSKNLKDRIGLEEIPAGQEQLIDIIDLMNNSHTFDMEYQKFYSEDKQLYQNMEPYGVHIFQRRWYVLARNPKNDTLHTYSLDRIVSLKKNNNTFKMPKDFSISDFFSDCFGIIKDATKKQHIVLKANAFQAKYLKSLPLHVSQRVVSEDDGFTIFCYDLRPTFDFKQKILSYMSNIEVIEPQSFRDEIMDDIIRMLKNYEKS
ncbi:MAG: WYL domain-containing protein [Bacteroidales bacterium]|nr:WYL domain-containing protein [Bacteroidales bacterium]